MPPQYAPPTQQVNNRYKTSMCRHFETTGFCHLGERCHFAHGPQELRTVNDPMPSQYYDASFKPPSQQKFQPNMPYNNFKTVKCKYFENDGFCRYGQNCSFAHGDNETRKPTDNLPPQYYDQQPPMPGAGLLPGQMFPTMMPPHAAPYGQPIMQQNPGSLLSASLLGSTSGSNKPNIIINTQDHSVNARLKIASDYINSGDNQAAEQILNELIYNGHIIITYDQQQPMQTAPIMPPQQPLQTAPMMTPHQMYGGHPGQKYAPYNPMEGLNYVQQESHDKEAKDKMF